MTNKFRLKTVYLIIVLCCVIMPYILYAAPKNVILMIGDGMGFEQVKAAGMYVYGPSYASTGTFCFESFPHQAEMTTYSLNNSTTDSAASATAIATGHKVNSGYVSKTEGGDDLETILEYFQGQGKRAGLVTTTYITHGTPACFAAHVASRYDLSGIADDYYVSRPNVLFGGSSNPVLLSSMAAFGGYTIIESTASMLSLDYSTQTYVASIFGGDGDNHFPYEYDGNYSSHPHLSEMTEYALQMLEQDPDGFFLMVEGGLIDYAGHANDLQKNIFETIEFSSAVQKVIDWAQGREDTLVLVTADHETGGLTVTANNGQNNWPTVTWLWGDHTCKNVPVYAWGVNSALVKGVMDNTDIFHIATANAEVSNIVPSSGKIEEDLDVVIYGSNFISTPTISFSGTGITVNSVSYLSSTSLSASINIAFSAPVGIRSVYVSNPSDSAVLAGYFEVKHQVQKEVLIDVSRNEEIILRPETGDIKVAIPANTFNSNVSLNMALAELPVNALNSSRFQASTIALDIRTADSSQPNQAVSITIDYSGETTQNWVEDRLRICRYDEGSKRWIILDSELDKLAKTIRAQTNHFSVFALMQIQAAADLDNIEIYPNPFKPSLSAEVYFDNLPEDVDITIYTISGELVTTIKERSGDGISSWNGKNDEGTMVASGVYLVQVNASKTLKLALIK